MGHSNKRNNITILFYASSNNLHTNRNKVRETTWGYKYIIWRFCIFFTNGNHTRHARDLGNPNTNECIQEEQQRNGQACGKRKIIQNSKAEEKEEEVQEV